MTYEVRLEVFEGPFHLLLSLISDHRVDVCDIPIAKLTEDYLAHVARMEHMDLEVATEFLVVAATLLQMKAKALLPGIGDGEGGHEEDDLERDLLIARLLEVRTFQSAGGHVMGLIATGDTRFPPVPAPDDDALRQLPVLGDLRPDDLARVLVELIREQNRTVDVSLVIGEEVSTQEAAATLTGALAGGPSTFGALCRGRSLSWGVAMFLALLELAMRGEVRIGQGERLGDISIQLT